MPLVPLPCRIRPTSPAIKNGLGYVLGLLSLFGFWLVPCSALLAIIALRVNSTPATWARRLSITGAWLCTLYTVVLAAWIAIVWVTTPNS